MKNMYAKNGWVSDTTGIPGECVGGFINGGVEDCSQTTGDCAVVSKQ